MTIRAIYWNLEPLMERRRIANANQLAERANITLPVAYRCLSGKALERIDVATVQTLTAFFRVGPWKLFRVE